MPERANLGDSLVITVNVHDTQFIVQCSLGDHEIGNCNAVPHAVVVGEITLQDLGPIQ